MSRRRSRHPYPDAGNDARARSRRHHRRPARTRRLRLSLSPARRSRPPATSLAIARARPRVAAIALAAFLGHRRAGKAQREAAQHRSRRRIGTAMPCSGRAAAGRKGVAVAADAFQRGRAPLPGRWRPPMSRRMGAAPRRGRKRARRGRAHSSAPAAAVEPAPSNDIGLSGAVEWRMVMAPWLSVAR